HAAHHPGHRADHGRGRGLEPWSPYWDGRRPAHGFSGAVARPWHDNVPDLSELTGLPTCSLSMLLTVVGSGAVRICVCAKYQGSRSRQTASARHGPRWSAWRRGTTSAQIWPRDVARRSDRERQLLCHAVVVGKGTYVEKSRQPVLGE